MLNQLQSLSSFMDATSGQSSAVRGSSPIILAEKQIRSFHDDGYLVLPAISTPEEVVQLRRIFDQLFASKAGYKEGAHYDMVSRADEEGTPKLSQIINPVNYASELRETMFRANALSIARQLLGPDASPAFEHAILKPARHGAATPWHQDEAHRFDPNFDYNQISIWMPLQQATLENGCMQYVSGSNKGEIVRHRSPGNDPTVHAIEADTTTFDTSAATPCPIPAGGCTIHGGRTLHYAGPNNSDAPRRAYILAFEVPPKPRVVPRSFPWNEHKQSASDLRKRAWRRRGGVIIEASRKLRSGMLTNPKRLVFEIRRAARTLFK